MELVAQDLWKYYGERAVVQGVNLSLQPGQVLGLLGPNGAGKTTTFGMLYGAVIPSRGFVQIGAYNVHRQGRQARQILGVVTQEDNLDPDFTVLENLVFFAHHYRITGRPAQRRAWELLEQAGLTEYAHQRVEVLSGGLKRRLVLARALVHHPKIVFLDEPTTGLDPDARQEFWRRISLLKQAGCSVLLTTHYMDEAQRLSDRLLLLQKGVIVDQGAPAELIQRIIGAEVAELEGVEIDAVQSLAEQAGVWWRRLGQGFVVSLPAQDSALWQALQAMNSTRLSRRQANLEDVFLRLTGQELVD
ncbi:ABC transporter, ATP-binding protein [Gloeomargarita lithophora Alchichica-D10]|uniref:ABC transporter, ATP-binding protein n=1 Tax=Gloeomargarita lithophora Alchichica-D10 TaxID=1188229 RepID=A0A1J0ABL5_9CYAN|nr:ABC transporter ATP-binding protein [Gloeomargarita lithophora]APB33297.1 ABC transporter, ATP-binding protein [Gloeomargarita lithophora Alchichica-D10]